MAALLSLSVTRRPGGSVYYSGGASLGGGGGGGARMLNLLAFQARQELHRCGVSGLQLQVYEVQQLKGKGKLGFLAASAFQPRQLKHKHTVSMRLDERAGWRLHSGITLFDAGQIMSSRGNMHAKHLMSTTNAIASTSLARTNVEVMKLVLCTGVLVELTFALYQFLFNQRGGVQSNSTNFSNQGFAGHEVSKGVKLKSAGTKKEVGFWNNSKLWKRAGRVTGSTLVMLVTAVCLAWWAGGAQPVLAAESTYGIVVLPQLGVLKGKVQFSAAAVWPKTLQVFEVLRDQGLLLSALLGCSAFFSMAETSITTLWPWKVRELAEKEGEGGVFHLLRQDVTRFLTTILIGTTVVNIAATALVTDAATALFGEAGVTAATGVMTVVLLMLTEICPKSIAVHNATEVARLVVRPVAWLSIVLYPVGRVVTALSTSLLKLLGLKSSGEPFVSEEELKLMLRGAELSGAIEEEEQDMIENVLEIKDTYVREVMTPLVDVVAIDATATLMEFRNLWVKHQYSRVPVFEHRIDNIVGIAYAMDMLDYVEQVELLQRLTVGRIAHRPAYFVPDSMSVWNLLREFRIRKVHMAIVLNEYGGTVGVVTLEDVVEEIVGEIFDENDSKEEIRKKTGYVVQRANGVYDVDANTSIEDLTDALEVKIPEGPYHYETVSGFVCEAFGFIPRTGESTKVVLRRADVEEGSERRDGETDQQEDRRDKFQKFRLEILAGNARKVGSVRFERLESPANERGLTRALWRSGDDTVNGKGDRDAADDHHWVDPNPDQHPQKEDMDDDLCKPLPEESAVGVKGYYYLPESLQCVDKQELTTSDGLSMVGSQEWEMDLIEGEVTHDLETDDKLDLSTATAVETLSGKWEEQERQVERRRNRRRKQSAEASRELDRQRRANLRRREAEAELYMATSPRRGKDEQSEPESFQVPES